MQPVSERGDRCSMAEYILEMKNIVKEYSGVRVLKNINLKIKKGEIHAICGENGAGKSTMLKILSGVIPSGQYSGEFLVNGEKMDFTNTAQSESKGIAIVHQELALAGELDVCENIYMGRLPRNRFGVVDWEKAYTDTDELLNNLTLTEQGINGHDKINRLSIGQQSLVEIAKALSKDARLLLLDEATSALTEREVDIFLKLVRKLNQQGVTIVYISHRLEEVMQIADTVTVLRDGELIATRPVKEITVDDIITYMAGRKITNLYPRVPHKVGEEALRVENYSAYNRNTNKPIFENISLSVRKGELLGISGLMGSKRTEFLESIFGCLDARITGKLFIEGKETEIHSPREAMSKGIAMITEDRKRYGLMQDKSVLINTTSACLDKVCTNNLLDFNKEVVVTEKYVKELSIKTPSIEKNVRSLSGGNQQKVVIAKWMLMDPSIILMDEPTRGVDVEAKTEIYRIINQFLDAGRAVIMVSSDMPEVMGMSDRIVVFREGRIGGEFEHDEATQTGIMACSVK